MTEDQRNRDEVKHQSLEAASVWLLVVLGLVALVFFVATIFASSIVASQNCPEPNMWCGLGQGSFGDAFGFVTSFFTGLAFLGLIFTVALQRMELRQTKLERRDAAEAFEDQRKVNLALRESQTQQVYEDRVFRLLDRIENQVKNVSDQPFYSVQHSAAAVILGLTKLRLPQLAGDQAGVANAFCNFYDDAFSGSLKIDAKHYFLDRKLVVTVATLIDTANKVDRGTLYPIVHSSIHSKFDLVIQLTLIRSMLSDQVPLKTLPQFELYDKDYFCRFDEEQQEALDSIRAALWPE